MNILHLVDTLEIGGAERVVVHLAKELAQRGHGVAVACVYAAGPLAQPLRNAGIRVWAFNKPEGLHPPTLWRLAQVVRECHADVIHTHNPQVHHYGVAAGKLAGTRVIVNTLHGTNNFDHCGRAALVLYGTAALGSGAIAAVSNASLRFFKKVPYLPNRKLTVVYNGIPLKQFLEIPSPSEGPVTFGIVGRLVPIKDHQTALKAFAAVVRERPECRLEIAGDGPLREALAALMAQLGLDRHVHFHGAVTDIAEFLNRTQVFVMSSLSEGMPMSLLEAMAAGRPVVATAVGGIPEVVEGSGCGWLCPEGDVDALARTMLAAADSPNRPQVGELGRQWVTRHCSLGSMVEHYEEIYRKLACQGG